MVLDRDDKLGTSSEFELRDDDRPGHNGYEAETGRSNFVAFLLGGVVVAGGLLSFLYYDSNNLQGMDQMTNGGFGQSSIPSLAPVPSIRILPRDAENK